MRLQNPQVCKIIGGFRLLWMKLGCGGSVKFKTPVTKTPSEERTCRTVFRSLSHLLFFLKEPNGFNSFFFG
jgi:hypothetical protein